MASVLSCPSSPRSAKARLPPQTSDTLILAHVSSSLCREFSETMGFKAWHYRTLVVWVVLKAFVSSTGESSLPVSEPPDPPDPPSFARPPLWLISLPSEIPSPPPLPLALASPLALPSISPSLCHLRSTTLSSRRVFSATGVSTSLSFFRVCSDPGLNIAFLEYRKINEWVALVLLDPCFAPSIMMVSSSCVPSIVPSGGIFIVLVRVFTAVCSCRSVFTPMVIALVLSSLLVWQPRKKTLIVCIPTVITVRLGFNCPAFSSMELELNQRLSSFVGFNFVPSYGIPLALVRSFTAVCRFPPVFTLMVFALMAFSHPLWQSGKKTSLNRIFPVNLAGWDFYSPSFSVDEFIFLPNTSPLLCDCIIGSIKLRVHLLEAEMRMQVISCSVSVYTICMTSTILEAFFPPSCGVFLDCHSEDVFGIGSPSVAASSDELESSHLSLCPYLSLVVALVFSCARPLFVDALLFSAPCSFVVSSFGGG